MARAANRWCMQGMHCMQCIQCTVCRPRGWTCTVARFNTRSGPLVGSSSIWPPNAKRCCIWRGCKGIRPRPKSVCAAAALIRTCFESSLIPAANAQPPWHQTGSRCHTDRRYTNLHARPCPPSTTRHHLPQPLHLLLPLPRCDSYCHLPLLVCLPLPLQHSALPAMQSIALSSTCAGVLLFSAAID